MNDELCRVTEEAMWSKQAVAMARRQKSCLDHASVLRLLYHTLS